MCAIERHRETSVSDNARQPEIFIREQQSAFDATILTDSDILSFSSLWVKGALCEVELYFGPHQSISLEV